MSAPRPASQPSSTQKPASPRKGEANTRANGYSSPSIIARRHRILDETRRMIDEVGITNLSMDDVAKRADVAKRTLYNAFQSKEHLVASAISKYFEDYANIIEYSTEAGSLDRMIEHLAIVAFRNLSIRNYTRALMNVYFSSDVDPEIRLAIHQIAAKPQEPWVLAMERKRQLQPWIDAEDLLTMLVRYRYATAHAWAEGLIPDDQLVTEVIRGFLTFAAGAVTGAARKQIIEVLTNLEDHPFVKNPPRMMQRKSKD
ncbi:MAG: TetR/AcrR family transcriptional regulator [Novosphingobium sp.]|nr:TetR/AcrR family transcriptional regulator [Novosphingobium sp.]